MSNKGIIGELSEKARRFEWKIPMFSTLCQTDSCFYDSPSFIFGSMKLHLRMYPPTDNCDFLSVHLNYESEPSCNVNFSFSIKKTDGTLIGTKTADESIMSYQPGCDRFFEGCDLRKQQSELLPSDTLTIICDLEAGGKQAEQHAEDAKQFGREGSP